MEQIQKSLFIILVFLILASIAGFYFYGSDKTESIKKLNLQNNTELQNNDNVVAKVENALIVKNNNEYAVKLDINGSEVLVDTCAAYDENSKSNDLSKVCTYSKLTFSPNKNYLTYSKLIYESGEIIVYDIKNKANKSFPLGNTIGFTNDEKYLFICSGNEMAGGYSGKIYETENLKEIYSVPDYYSIPNDSPYMVTKCNYDSATETISFTSEDIFNPTGSKLPEHTINYDVKNKSISTKSQSTNSQAQPSSSQIKNTDPLPEVVAQKAIDYINKNLLSDATAALGRIDNTGTINTLYQFNVSVSGKSFISYVSDDGKYLFTQEAYDLTAGDTTLGTTEQPIAATKAVVQKAIDYMNKNLLSNGTIATLDKINSANTINKLYKFTVKVSGSFFDSYVSADGKYLFAQEPMDLTKNLSTNETTPTTTIEGNFKEEKDTKVCLENNKPIVYFFGSTTCPHCLWEKLVLKSVIDQFGSTVSYHENIDSDKDQEIFSKYSSGSVPTLVIGCKYYRVGSGEAVGVEAEKVSLRKVICRATGNLPANICQ